MQEMLGLGRFYLSFQNTNEAQPQVCPDQSFSLQQCFNYCSTALNTIRMSNSVPVWLLGCSRVVPVLKLCHMTGEETVGTWPSEAEPGGAAGAGICWNLDSLTADPDDSWIWQLTLSECCHLLLGKCPRSPAPFSSLWCEWMFGYQLLQLGKLAAWFLLFAAAHIVSKPASTGNTEDFKDEELKIMYGQDIMVWLINILLFSFIYYHDSC